MQIQFSHLKTSLASKRISPLLVSGDEPYQHMLACDLYRERVRELGFTERKVLTVETGFDWSALEQEKNNLSLFGERTLIDLRIPNGKPGVSGSKAIVGFTENLHDDVMLLVQTPRLDRNTINSAWVKALGKVGMILRVWPLNETNTRKWIQQKLKAKGFMASQEIVEFITQQVEGNLLAAMQEIEKLDLLCESKRLDIKNIHSVLCNSSHYSINELMDVVLNGDVARIIRIIHGLKKEDVAPSLLLWGLTEQARKLVENKTNVSKPTANQKDQLKNFNQLHQEATDVREDIVHSKTSYLLKQCAHLDKVIKGRAVGDPWRELLQLSVSIRQEV